MSKLRLLAASVQLGVLLIAGGACQRIDDLESRVDTLEDAVNTIQSLINSGYFVSDYTQTADGWTLVMRNGAGDSKSLNVINGKDGADGKDGLNGKDGKDGADGKDGVDGKNGLDGKDGNDGADGDTIFANVEIKDTYVIITLADGNTFIVPLDNSTAVTMIKSMVLVPAEGSENSIPVQIAAFGSKCLGSQMDINLNVVPSSAATALSQSLSTVTFAAEFVDKSGNKVEENLAPSSVSVEGSVVTLSFKDSGKIQEWFAQKAIPAYLSVKVADGRGNDFTTPYYKLEPQVDDSKVSFTLDGIKFNMIKISAATFWMGSPATDAHYDADEILHQVKISKDYYLGEFEVTNELYNKLISGHTSTWSTKAKQPVTDIWRADAEEFCEKLSERLGVAFRLPTEAEWEYAARGGDVTGESSLPFPLNERGRFDRSMGNYLDGMYYDATQPEWDRYQYDFLKVDLDPAEVKEVGSYAPNAYGLYDMIGNVAEFVQDYYKKTFYTSFTSGIAVDPVNDTYDGMTVVKGGAFGSDLYMGRIPYHKVATTDPIPPFMMTPTSGTGIRLCVTAE